MWNRLVTPSINDREGMGGGGEGTSAKYENGGMEWLSAEAMTVDVGVEVGLWFCFMACAIKDKEQVGIQDVIASTLNTRLYRNPWEHVA